jgi:hypothetical protein
MRPGGQNYLLDVGNYRVTVYSIEDRSRVDAATSGGEEAAQDDGAVGSLRPH